MTREQFIYGGAKRLIESGTSKSGPTKEAIALAIEAMTNFADKLEMENRAPWPVESLVNPE